ncbi:hypothetical protein [Psychromicrobium xiongbiense]|uniref:hypothetical protein n=1 Tax=Psychromicrobium xiongbiense TaxID=3051184 RepID=UPI002554200B|nr:hypothetical protein [Psychromicrobium sp. YIM S02556]
MSIQAPAVALVWWLKSDNYFNNLDCRTAAFEWMNFHNGSGAIRDYECIQNQYGQNNPGQWSLWFLAPDSAYPPF